MGMNENVDINEVTQQLVNLPDDTLIKVPEQVFKRKLPYLFEADYETCHFFMAMARRMDEWEMSTCQPPYGTQYPDGWRITAVAYIDEDSYAPDAAYGDECAQGGHCRKCHVHLRSTRKHAVCPICGTKAYLT